MNVQATALEAAVAATPPPVEGLELEEGLGDLLFTCVRLAYQLRIDPEIALRKANDKFERLFRHLEVLGKNERLEAVRRRNGEENPASPVRDDGRCSLSEV